MFNDPGSTVLRAISRVTRLRPLLMNRLCPQAETVLKVGDDYRWEFRLMGKGPALSDTWIIPGWQIVAVDTNNPTSYPASTLEKVQAVNKAGVLPKKWLIANEYLHLLSGSATARSPWQRWRRQLIEATTTPSKTVVQVIYGAVLVALLSLIFLPILFSLLVVALLVVALVIGAVVVGGAADFDHPVLVAVTDDNFWVEVDRWETEGELV